MKCSEEVILMHKHLDEEITKEEYEQLQQHIRDCLECKEHFYELLETEALLKGAKRIKAPQDFTQSILNQLPKEKKRVSMKRYFIHHPLLTAIAIFMLFMMGSLYSGWSQDRQNFEVSGPSVYAKGQLVIDHKHHLVTIPKGQVVRDDLTIKNGNLRVEGELRGKAVIINGDKQLAKAGEVTGEIEEIDQVFSWIWYKIKGIF